MGNSTGECLSGPFPYRTSEAFRSALSDRIGVASVSSDGFTINQLRRQFAYGRLLARIFTGGESRWVLKGAGGLLARLPGYARHSLDIDLFHQGDMASGIEELQRLGGTDPFGDFFTFDINAGQTPAPDAPNVALGVVAFLGEREFERFKVDLVVVSNLTAAPELIVPISPIDIPGLTAVPYLVYPLVDHIADKHAAMIEPHRSGPSTRYRDLVDLVIIATSNSVDAASLHVAMVSEYTHRSLAVPEAVELPSEDWISGYQRAATTARNLHYPTATEALAIVKKMLDPILAGRSSGIWDPVTLQWVD